jgi:hypothetical protein
MTEGENSRLLDFNVRKMSAKAKPTNYDRPTCLHWGVEVSKRDQTLNCVDCGVNVNPYEWIERLAQKERGALWDLKRQTEMSEELDRFIRHGGTVRVSKSGASVSLVLNGQTYKATSRGSWVGSSSAVVNWILQATKSVWTKTTRKPSPRLER